jgi:hypothetical protein
MDRKTSHPVPEFPRNTSAVSMRQDGLGFGKIENPLDGANVRIYVKIERGFSSRTQDSDLENRPLPEFSGSSGRMRQDPLAPEPFKTHERDGG